MWSRAHYHERVRAVPAVPPNEEMQLTKPDGIRVGGHGDHVRCRRAIVFESGLAADLRCWADGGKMICDRGVPTAFCEAQFRLPTSLARTSS
jgi:hypothetical protein